LPISWKKNQELSKAKKCRKKEVLIRQINKKLKETEVKKIIDYEIKPKDLQVTRKNGTKIAVHSFEINAKINKEKKKRSHKIIWFMLFHN